MKKTRWHSCNVLHAEPGGRHLWQFSTGNGQVTRGTHLHLPAGRPLPPRVVGRDWGALFNKKLNIAWLPADQVFLRVVRLPKSEPSEVAAMVELQLEKISPLPVNQVVWSFEVLPNTPGDMQTVVVILAERTAVEQFLSGLEGSGYLADRLEVPLLHQLAATPAEEDGVWIFLGRAGGRVLALLAWWFEGSLQMLSLARLPSDATGVDALCDQLSRIAWAGEFEGWLKGKPPIQLISEPDLAGLYEPALGRWGGRVQVHGAPDLQGLAELSARRSTASNTTANLLPDGYASRYRQQFVDRLWMRGLGAAAVLYLAGVLVYLGALQVRKYQKSRLDREVASISGAYTNALQLKTRLRILQDQTALRFAALDCWKVASELLPAELTLKTFKFSNGNKLTLSGEAPVEDQARITEYNTALAKATLNGEVLFARVKPATISSRAGNSATWNFDCDLRITEAQ